MIDVLLLISTNGHFLTRQIELCKKHIPDIRDIYIIDGPFGIGFNMDYSGVDYDKKVTLDRHDNANLLATKSVRIKAVMHEIHSKIRATDAHTLVLHSDCVPISRFEYKNFTHGICGKKDFQSDQLYYSIPWLLIAPDAPLSFCEYFEKPTKTYKSKLCYANVIIDCDEIFSTEYCEPCFWHIDNADLYFNKPKEIERRIKLLDLFLNEPSMEEADKLSKNLISMGIRYVKEYSKWKKMGKVLRSPEEMELIHSICSSCPFFDKEDDNEGSCGICGCRISKIDTNQNKAAFATTRCPKTPPSWMPYAEFIGDKQETLRRCTSCKNHIKDTED